MSWLRRVRALSHFGQRPAYQQLLTLEATGQLLAVKIMLHTIPFKRWNKLLHAPVRAQASSTWDPRVKAIVWAVARVSSESPQALACLPRALAVRAMLERRRLPCQLRIGVRRNPNGQFDAHAWVEYQGQIIIGNLPDLATFTELSRSSPGAAPNKPSAPPRR